MKKTLFTLILAIFFISPEILRADNFSIGTMAISRPNYEGADGKQFDILPLIDINIGKSFFLNTERGLGAYFRKSKALELGGSFGYYESRKEEDDDKLKGLGNIDGGIDGRIFAKIRSNEYSIFVRCQVEHIDAKVMPKCQALLNINLKTSLQTETILLQL